MIFTELAYVQAVHNVLILCCDKMPHVYFIYLRNMCSFCCTTLVHRRLLLILDPHPFLCVRPRSTVNKSYELVSLNRLLSKARPEQLHYLSTDCGDDDCEMQRLSEEERGGGGRREERCVCEETAGYRRKVRMPRVG